MLVDLREVLDIAKKKNIAIPAFNTYNMETVMGIIKAGEELSAPLIIQSYSRLFSSEEGYYLSPIILAAIKKASIPVCFHLDHGAGEREVIRAIRYGCSGIMIDASAKPMAENIAITKDVVRLCSHVDIPVEGELGHVGTVNESIGADTEVADAVQFSDETGVAALAVAVGTAHGRYKQAPKLNITRIAEIASACTTPLVLHGGSGIPDGDIQRAIAAGIRKVNFGTDVCYSFLDKVFETDRSKIAVDVFMKDSIENVKSFAMEKIKLLGADS